MAVYNPGCWNRDISITEQLNNATIQTTLAILKQATEAFTQFIEGNGPKTQVATEQAAVHAIEYAFLINSVDITKNATKQFAAQMLFTNSSLKAAMN